MDALIFIDTNILLDFYRVRGRDRGIAFLGHIASNYPRIITTSQVEMEYKNNRQRTILESLSKARTPDWSSIQIPPFLAESRHSRGIEKGRKQVDTQMRRMRDRIGAALKNPAKHDAVYKVAQGLFQSQSPYNLSRVNESRGRIRRLALRRFGLGYPPRKDGDTSIGDAVNWEWVVHCSSVSKKDIIIVSRDNDYGVSYQDAPVLNDWLRQEFTERTSRRRRIVLTDRLAEAFKLIAVPVSKEEVEQEQELIVSVQPRLPDEAVARALRALAPVEETLMRLLVSLDGVHKHTVQEAAAALGLPLAATIERMTSAMRNLQPEYREAE